MKEKSQIEKNAEERQIELLSTALNEASNAGGHWLNAAGKGFPKFYPRGVAVSPFNGLFMALHLSLIHILTLTTNNTVKISVFAV